MDHFAIYFTTLTTWALAHWDSHFSLEVTGLPHDPTNHRTRIRIQLYDWTASHKFMKIKIPLTLQRLQHNPLAHWYSCFSLQVTGLQHGSTILQLSGLPQSRPNLTYPSLSHHSAYLTTVAAWPTGTLGLSF